MSNLIYLKGPSFYKETDQDIFWGRDKEIDDIYYLVSNSDFSICYAKSGEGKSSLINAGLIPILRKKGFLPICIRFTSSNYKEENPDFDKIIGGILEETINNIEDGSIYKSMDIDKDLGNIPCAGKPLCDTLWWKLRVNEIRKDAFTQLTPVLIFDQFEEVFTCSENIEWVNMFFAWLECLYNDMNPLDDANIGRLPKKFKVLLSLRSEYVCELDYWSMQRYFIPSLKNNRYYLKALTGNNAEEIADKILDRANIGNISKDDVLRFSQNEDTDKSYKDTPCKSALKLSLILDTCYRYNEKVKELINDKGNTLSLSDILEIYYDEATKKMTRKQRDKIEDLLVDSRGRRNIVSLSELASVLDEDLQNILKEKRIIITVNAHEVEIAHDCMCEIIFKHSNERRKAIEYERNIAIKNKWFVIVFVILSFCAVASFFLFRHYAYPEIKENYLLTNSVGDAWLSVVFCKAEILLFLPYLLPLAAIGIYCRIKGSIKNYVNPTDILSVVFGTISVVVGCFLHDAIFSEIIGKPDMLDSIFYVVIPILVYLSCIFYSWGKLQKSIKLIGFVCLISLFPIIEYFKVFFSFWAICPLLFVAIWVLVATFKELPTKECVCYVIMNISVLFICSVAHLGYWPWIIDCSKVRFSMPWKCIVIEKEKKYGVVDAVTGDTIVPCIFDGITNDGLVMLLSPSGEELYDLPLGVTNKDSVISTLHDRGDSCKLDNKDCIRYIWQADKRLYDISKEDKIYKGKAVKVYFTVRNELYKAIKQNTPINKIDKTLLEELYEQERDSIKTLRNRLLKKLSDNDTKLLDNDTEFIIVHTTRQMSIATILDMINDNRSKLSLRIALWSYVISYFSKELHDENVNFKANVHFNYNEEITHNVISKDSAKKKKYSNVFSLNTKFSNDDFSMLGTWSLGQYVYINTLSIAAPLFARDVESNLPLFVSNMIEQRNHLIEELLNSCSYNSKDVGNAIGKNKSSKDLVTSIIDVIHAKESKQLSLIDSLRVINGQYKSFNPFAIIETNRLKETRRTATDNIRLFSILYEAFSSNNDYHYALCRQELIDNLQVAGFCGKDSIINEVGSLEKNDSYFFNRTYERMKSIKGKVCEIRNRAKEWDNNGLKTVKMILQNRLKKY